MRNKLMVLIACLALPLLAAAGPNLLTTNYFNNFKVVQGHTSVGDTGLGLGTNYACFALQDLSDITYIHFSNDVRVLLHSILIQMYDVHSAKDATNQFSLFTIDEVRTRGTGALWKVKHEVELNKNVGTWTYPGE